MLQQINTQLAGELLNIVELATFIDKAIDDVNTRLNTKFPVITDVLQAQKDEYTAIPDKYIRTVIIPGAVFKYYTTDEEGAAVAPKYEEEYLKGLFYMERDYLNLIPEEYQDSDAQGWVSDPNFKPNPYNSYERGEFEIDGSVFQL
jgi:hypothetical protein